MVQMSSLGIIILLCFSGPTTRWNCEWMHAHDDGWTGTDGRHGNADATACHDFDGTSCQSYGHTGKLCVCG